MRRIAIINQKGGVGKTTTAVNLGAALARAGKRVCILDLDPQAHATTHLGIEPDGESPSMYDALINNTPLAEVRTQVADNLWLAGSDINLAAAEVELAGVVGREVILRDLLAAEPEPFDFVLMDCAPSLGVLTLNALCCGQRSVHPAPAAFPRPARPQQAAGNDRPRQQTHQSAACVSAASSSACAKATPGWPRKSNAISTNS